MSIYKTKKKTYFIYENIIIRQKKDIFFIWKYIRSLLCSANCTITEQSKEALLCSASYLPNIVEKYII